ncbi:MAG: GspH/FimT family pseudopilin [Granulosicoccus sp.]
MEKYSQKGFTLIELMVALAVAAILLGIGVPSFTEALRNSRLSSQYNELVQSLYLARSEAIKGSADVVVCARADDDSCDENGDWSNGWLVYADIAPLDVVGSAQIDAGDIVLRVSPPLSGENTIIAQGSSDRTLGGMPASSAYIRYTSSGESNWANGTFQLCDGIDGAERASAVNVVWTGDIRRGRPTADSGDTPLHVFGAVIDCSPISSS